jgi:hypothetical protein
MEVSTTMEQLVEALIGKFWRPFLTAEILTAATMQAVPDLKAASPEVQEYFASELLIALHAKMDATHSARWVN